MGRWLLPERWDALWRRIGGSPRFLLLRSEIQQALIQNLSQPELFFGFWHLANEIEKAQPELPDFKLLEVYLTTAFGLTHPDLLSFRSLQKEKRDFAVLDSQRKRPKKNLRNTSSSKKRLNGATTAGSVAALIFFHSTTLHPAHPFGILAAW